ncbi:MAG: hypothetical protein HDR36_01100 [Treponema sp.]|nr:hypothetical protein [Treponema sp.]
MNTITSCKELCLIKKVKVFFLALVALYSMRPYFLWDKNIVLLFFNIMLFLCVFLEFFFGKGYGYRKIDRKNIYCIGSFLLLYVYVYVVWAGGIVGLISQIPLYLFPTLVMLLCSQGERIYFLSLLTAIVSFLLFISLCFYFLYLFGFYTTYTKIQHPTAEAYDFFYNYKFFIMCNDTRSVIFSRFQGVFTEPGQIGMICALLLYANRYHVRQRKVFVLLISIVFTLSLAAYILLVCGWIMYLYFNSKNRIKAVLSVCIVGGVLVGGTLIYYSLYPNTIYSKWVIARLMPDKKRGIAGNNRNSSEFKRVYSNFLSSGGLVVFTGKGTIEMKKYSAGNSSYKVYVFEYGFLGLFMLFLFYVSILYFFKSRLLIGMLLLYFLSFLQRPYALWTSEIYIYVCAAISFYVFHDGKERKKKIKRRKIYYLCHN